MWTAFIILSKNFFFLQTVNVLFMSSTWQFFLTLLLMNSGLFDIFRFCNHHNFSPIEFLLWTKIKPIIGNIMQLMLMYILWWSFFFLFSRSFPSFICFVNLLDLYNILYFPNSSFNSYKNITSTQFVFPTPGCLTTINCNISF